VVEGQRPTRPGNRGVGTSGVAFRYLDDVWRSPAASSTDVLSAQPMNGYKIVVTNELWPTD